MNIVMKAAAATMLLAGLGSGSLHAQGSEAVAKLKPAGFPSQPIELSLAFPAGGGLDTTARLIATAFEKVTGERAVVVNRTGGGGFVGHNWFVRQAPKDGHVVAILSLNFFSDAVRNSRGAWSWKDVDYIAFINADPTVWFASTSGRFAKADLAEVLKAACDKPGSITLGATPGGVSGRLADAVESGSGCTFNKVPYQGSIDTKVDMLGGHLDIGFGQFTDYRGEIEAGTARAIAVAATARMSALPDTPIFSEKIEGEPIVVGQWRSVALPRGVDPQRRAWLAAAFHAAIASEEVQKEFARLGVLVDPSLDTPEKVTAAAEVIGRKEEEMWKKP